MENLDPQTLVIIVLLVVVFAIVAVLALRKPKKPEEPRPKAREPEEGVRPKDVLEDRMEVEAPVEIDPENMSLAEIKRAKAARISGDKGKRETAVQATERAREEAGEAEEAPGDEADAAPEESEAELEPKAVEEEGVDSLADVSAGWEVLEESFGVDLEEEEAAAPPPDEAEEAADEVEPEVAAEVDEEVVEEPPEDVEEAEVQPEEPPEEEPEPEPKSLADGLEKTRTGFIERLGSFFTGDQLDENLVEEVEEVLYTADIGTRAAQHIIEAIENELSKEEKDDPGAVWAFVRSYVEEMLEQREKPLDIDSAHPFVIVVIGVNGVGKTTTIGKLASKYRRAGKSVLLVAGDTFRAAAVEQIEVWGDRVDVPVHIGDEKADPASVVYSGVERAVEEDFDVVICDTAGRLHTKAPLLEELGKIGRVAAKVVDGAPHETILVLDANTGQNAIQQAKMFREAMDITGIVLTKLDGTAKGGVILGISDELDAPIRYIGIGEGIRDLRRFDAEEFVEALFM